MAIKMVISEKVINDVITHQFDSANDALNIHKSVELSGFGKFYFNQSKAIKTMQKYSSQKDMYETVLEDPTLSDVKRANVQVRLANLLISMKTLKPKIDETRTDI